MLVYQSIYFPDLDVKYSDDHSAGGPTRPLQPPSNRSWASNPTDERRTMVPRVCLGRFLQPLPFGKLSQLWKITIFHG